MLGDLNHTITKIKLNYETLIQEWSQNNTWIKLYYEDKVIIFKELNHNTLFSYYYNFIL